MPFAGGVQDPNINIVSDPRKFLGISDSFGFTKKNEVFVGRVAMLGFAAELIGELAQGGKGPLGQLGMSFDAANADYLFLQSMPLFTSCPYEVKNRYVV